MVEKIKYHNGTIIYENENGQLHRDDGPAVIHSNGNQFWCLNEKIHREDGPAVIYSNGDVVWYLNGQRYTFKEWCEKNTNISDEEKIEIALRFL